MSSGSLGALISIEPRYHASLQLLTSDHLTSWPLGNIFCTAACNGHFRLATHIQELTAPICYHDYGSSKSRHLLVYTDARLHRTELCGAKLAIL